VELTEQEAVRIGMAFRRLTHTDEFERVIEILKAQFMQQITGSAYGDTVTREESFQQLRALDELMTTINTFIAIADADSLEVAADDMEIFE
jgi:hypothetical protein